MSGTSTYIYNPKINEFHWHIVDSQSFPLQVPGFTDLAAKGAYDAPSVYSPSDVAGIVAYAGAVGATPLPYCRGFTD